MTDEQRRSIIVERHSSGCYLARCHFVSVYGEGYYGENGRTAMEARHKLESMLRRMDRSRRRR